MSGMFGGGQKAQRRMAAEQQRMAQKQTQQSNEESMRSQQKAERGSGRAAARPLLMGNLSAPLQTTAGA